MCELWVYVRDVPVCACAGVCLCRVCTRMMCALSHCAGIHVWSVCVYRGHLVCMHMCRGVYACVGCMSLCVCVYW